jgi:hypothetical protein
VLALACAGCSGDEDDSQDQGPQILVDGTGSGTTGRAPAPAPANANHPSSTGLGGPVSVGEPTRAEYCAGSGAPVSVQPGAGTGGSACGSGLATRIFEYGLCSCSDASFTGSFAIDAFDSTQGGYQPGQVGGSVGVNDQLLPTGTLDIHGSLIAAGAGTLAITSSYFNVDGNFETNADLQVTGANITFGRDLWVNGDISAVGLSQVLGDVYQTPGHALPSGMTIGGQRHTHDFSVAEPCACAEDQLLDIDAIVATGAAHSHNAELGLGTDALGSVGLNQLDLECGRFAFQSTQIVGATVLRVDGRTALFIDGDFTITGSFGVDLGSSGELDVFVTGNLVLTGAGQVGSRERPAALRLYVGGSGDIAITGANQFAANLYAPRSNVIVTGADDLYGALFVGSYTAIGAQRMHYDAAVLRAGDGGDRCDDPPDCSTDTNCPAPNVCESGRCVPLSDGPD